MAGDAAREPIRLPSALTGGLRAIGLLGWGWIVAQTLLGGTSAASVAPLFLWVYGWVGIAMVSAFVGPVWVWLNPFSTLFDLLAAGARRLGIRGWEPVAYPPRLAEWPAVAGMVGVIWLELVGRGLPLGPVLVAYTAVTLLLMAQFGKAAWLERGETFSVWFGLLGRMAPFEIGGSPERRMVFRRPMGSGLATGDWPTPRLVLVALGTASIIYDGLSQTEPWFRVFGLPSLAGATLLLFGFLAGVALVILGVARVVGSRAVGVGLIPIAIGYLVAHYFTYLIGDGQAMVLVLSDPLQLGWDLFGTAFYEPGLGWLPPGLLWTIMLGAVVGGHVTGAWAGHAAASDRRGRVRRPQWPLAVLMVGLTTLTLWSLGQVVVTDTSTSGSPGPVAATVRA